MAPEISSTDSFVVQAGDEGLFDRHHVWIFSDAYSTSLVEPSGPPSKLFLYTSAFI